MPVRSLRSPVLRWPNATEVERAFRAWAEQATASRAGIRRIGFFGSYADNTWGVGSDLDVVVIITESEVPFIRRAAEWDTTDLPVPVDLLVYTENEWTRMEREKPNAFGARVRWVYEAS